MSHVISVVIPVWRDTAQLLTLLDSLPSRPDLQIVVGTTTDEFDDITRAVGDRPGVLVVASSRGRAAQMNAGARIATGDWLLFLHADSQLPLGALDEVTRLSVDPETVGGSFRFALDAPGWRARLMEWGTAQRTRWCRLPYGDQGLFVKRALFERMGGYRDMPLMEDVEFVRRLRRMGRLHRSSLRMITSARRWHRDGWFRRMGQNWLLMVMYSAGVSPRRLARRYEHRRPSVVAILARAPSQGGKSRLFRSLGIQPNVSLTTALLSDTLTATERVPDVDRALVYTPNGCRPEMEALTTGDWTYLTQHDGDLGQRMAAAFADLHGLGYEAIVLVGSDLPTLPPALLSRALRTLRTRVADVVLGPSTDGGYFLIALSRPIDALFQGVSWSTGAVLEQTRERARALGLSVEVIDAWYDVDDAATLRRAAQASPDSRVAAWWRSHTAERE